MKSTDIMTRTVQPLQDAPGRQINMSRNVIGVLSGLTPTQLNAIVAVVDALQKGLKYGSSYEGHVFADFMIPIPYSVVGSSRDRKRLQQELERLIGTKYRYTRPIPGAEYDVTTTIISAVVRKDAQFYVTVPATALPFYAYCGQSVGFAQIERDVVLHLPSTQQKLLNILLAEKIDYHTQSGKLVMSPAELAQILGLPVTTTYSTLRHNVIDPYIKSVSALKSRYTVDFKVDKDRHPGRKGQPKVTLIRLTMSRDDKAHSQNDEYVAVHTFLSKYMQYLDDPCSSPISVADKLLELGSLSDFSDSMSRILERARSKGDLVKRHIANTLRKVLRENYRIPI